MTHESNRSKFAKLIQLLLLEFPDKVKFMENVPLIEVRIREGLSPMEKQSLVNEFSSNRNLALTNEEKLLKKIKVKTINKINYYKAKIQDAMFPNQNKKRKNEILLEIGNLERKAYSMNDDDADDVCEDTEEGVKVKKRFIKKDHDIIGIENIIKKYKDYFPVNFDVESYVSKAWYANIPPRCGLFSYDNVGGIFFIFQINNFI